MAWLSETHKEKAKRIIEYNDYMVLSTSDKKGKPWGNVVLFAFDGKKGFYFISATDSLHASNIVENPNIAFVIFDSTQPLGSIDSIQANGRVSLVEKDGIEDAIKCYCAKVFPDSSMPPTKRYSPGDYLGPAEFRFYKITVDKLYLSGPDRREEVEM